MGSAVPPVEYRRGQVQDIVEKQFVAVDMGRIHGPLAGYTLKQFGCKGFDKGQEIIPGQYVGPGGN